MVDGGRPEAPLLSDRPDRAAQLASASAAKEADEALRARPLSEGERIDANRASASELDRLPGVGPALADAWVAHRESQGGFSDAAGLTAVRGIGPATAARLAPWLQFSSPPPMLRPRERRSAMPTNAAGRDSPLVDLNTADSARLVALPGIGPALAARIVARRRVERFRRVEELTEVQGIGPATLERLRAAVTVRRR